MFPQYTFHALDGYVREERKRAARERRHVAETRIRDDERCFGGEQADAVVRRRRPRARSLVPAPARSQTC